jgi:hypothetical protein
MKFSRIAAVVLSLLVTNVEAHSLVADGFKEEKSSLRGGNVGKILVRKNTSRLICLCYMLPLQSSTAHGDFEPCSSQMKTIWPRLAVPVAQTMRRW